MKGLLGDLGFIAKRLNQTLYDWRTQRGVLLRYPTASIDRSVRIVNQRRLELGEHVIIQSGVVLHCGGLAWSNGRGAIRIGSHSVISPNCVFYGAGTIQIGDNFDCGPGVMLFSSRSVFEQDRRQTEGEHHFAPIVIGRGVTLFGGCVVSPGVTIGDGAVVAAGAVVLRDVAAHTFVAGAPAHLVRPLS
jgi:maltose O-acetyltransferase